MNADGLAAMPQAREHFGDIAGHQVKAKTAGADKHPLFEAQLDVVGGEIGFDIAVNPLTYED